MPAPMQTHEYIVVPLNIGIREGDKDGQTRVTSLFSSLLNEYARQGWEYESFEAIPVLVSPGCLGALLGAKATSANYYCVVFRKPTGSHAPLTTQEKIRQSTTRQPAPKRTLSAALPPPAPTTATATLQRFFYLDVENETQGPVTRSALKSLLEDGSVGYDTLVCPEGGEQWTKLEEHVAP